METTTTLPTGTSLPANPTSAPSVTASTAKISITASADPSFRLRVATVCARASQSDPFNNMLQREKYADPDVPTIDLDGLIKTNLARIDSKCDQGAFLVEAGNFAAVACWEPPICTASPKSSPNPDEVERSGRLVYAGFVRDIQRVKAFAIPKGQAFWKLSLMARDPGRGGEKGVVRGVMEYGLERARKEGLSVWLEAGNERARDVYAYFGFRILEELKNGKGKYDKMGRRKDGGDGVSTWLMVRDWTEEERGR